MKRYFDAYRGFPREVYFLFLAKLVNSMGMFIMPLLTLIMTQKLALTTDAAGKVAALLVLTQAPCVILGGKLADSIGRMKVMVGGSLGGALFYLVCGCGLTGYAMLACIILAADLISLTVPAAEALLADYTTPEQRQGAYSLLYLGGNIGMAVSPILGGLLFQRHLSLLFLLDGATTIAGVLILLLNVRERFARQPAETAARQPTLRSALKAAPYIVGFALLLFLYDFCYAQWSFLLPAEFGSRFGEGGAKLYSVLCSANAVTVIALTPLITRLTHRLPPLRAIALAGALYAAAYLGFALAPAYGLLVVCGELFTLGEICSTIQIGAFVSTHIPAACLGRVTAFTTFVRGASYAVGPLAMGGLLTFATYHAGWYVTAGVVCCGGLGMVLLNRQVRAAEEFTFLDGKSEN